MRDIFLSTPFFQAPWRKWPHSPSYLSSVFFPLTSRGVLRQELRRFPSAVKLLNLGKGEREIDHAPSPLFLLPLSRPLHRASRRPLPFLLVFPRSRWHQRLSNLMRTRLSFPERGAVVNSPSFWFRPSVTCVETFSPLPWPSPYRFRLPCLSIFRNCALNKHSMEPPQVYSSLGLSICLFPPDLGFG